MTECLKKVGIVLGSMPRHLQRQGEVLFFTSPFISSFLFFSRFSSPKGEVDEIFQATILLMGEVVFASPFSWSFYSKVFSPLQKERWTKSFRRNYCWRVRPFSPHPSAARFYSSVVYPLLEERWTRFSGWNIVEGWGLFPLSLWIVFIDALCPPFKNSLSPY